MAGPGSFLRRGCASDAPGPGRDCAKHEGGVRRTVLNDTLLLSPQPDPTVIQLDEALVRLAEFDSRKAKVVEMCYFGGLTAEEIAVVLHISVQSVKRDWSLAKSWLVREMNREERDGAGALGVD
jgi:RNA polymerase sigma-70 factor, ECF subfamily